MRLIHPRGRQSVFIAIMLVTAAVALAIPSRAWFYPICLAGLLAAHVFGGIVIPGTPRLFTSMMLAVPFALWYRSLGTDGLTGFPPVDVLYLMAFYALAFGTHHLLTARGTARDARLAREDRGGDRAKALAAALIGFGLAGTASKRLIVLHSSFVSHESQSNWFIPLVVVFVACLLLEMRRAIESRGAAPRLRRGMVLAIAAAMVAGGAFALQRYGIESLPLLSNWATRKLLAGQRGGVEAGYSRTASLGSVPEMWDDERNDEVMLRCWSDRHYLHLRASAYQRYDRGTWLMMPENHKLTNTTTSGGRRVFVFDSTPNEKIAGTVYLDSSLGDSYFMPMGVNRVGTFANTVLASEAWGARSPGRGSAAGYDFYEPAGAMPKPTEDDLFVPESLRADLIRIGKSVLRQGDTPDQHAAMIESYFQTHFEYKLGIEIRPGVDPVIQFLDTDKAGHCEYFASAAVMLLRIARVPARYVTGFACQEQGLGDRYWIARRKDAHAWVEYYTPEKGWRTLDPTPPNGRPQPRTASSGDRWKDMLRSLLARVTNVVAYGGLFAIISILWEALSSFVLAVPIFVWVIIGLIATAWVYRAPLLRMLTGKRASPASARAREYQLKLARAESLVARHGLSRSPGTPVGQFLAAVRAAPLPDDLRNQTIALLEDYQANRFREQV